MWRGSAHRGCRRWVLRAQVPLGSQQTPHHERAGWQEDAVAQDTGVGTF